MQNPYLKLPSDRHALSNNKLPVQVPVQEIQSVNSASRKRPFPTSSTAAALIISATGKAGMDDVDRSRIDEIILRESGDSKFMQQQRRRDAKVNERIEAYQKRIQQASPSEYAIAITLEQRLLQWQSVIATRATCVVVDMDMFYMACELLDKPHLRDVPACVGRGMILTSNYLARKFGVRSAMPGWIGDKLVEELSGGSQRLVHVRSNFELYKRKSKQVLQVLGEFDPKLRSYSLDEAYLDLGPYLAIYLQQQHQQQQHHHQQPHDDEPTVSTSIDNRCHSLIRQKLIEPTTTKMDYHYTLRAVSHHTCRQALEQIVHFMRGCVEQSTGGLTCSAGIAPTIALAKIASDRNKPNGQCFVDPSQVLEFVRPLPVRKIPGIGRVTEKILNACDVTTVNDLWEQRGLINWLFPPATGEFLLKASVGCMGEYCQDDEEEDNHHQKGISRERTFAAVDCWTTLQQKLHDIAQLLSQDMARKQVWATTITVKVKLDSFDVYSRSKRLPRGTDLLVVATPLLAQIRDEHLATGKRTFSCRLLGIRCSNLEEQDPKVWTMERFLTKKCLPINSLTESEAKPKQDATPDQIRKASTTASSMNRQSIREIQKGKCQSHDSAKQPSPSSLQSTPLLGKDMTAVASKEHCLIDSSTTGSTTVQCPLCQRSFLAKDNDALNQHLDTCLSGSTVRQAVRETQKIWWKNNTRT